jgi:hypothetical protein
MILKYLFIFFLFYLIYRLLIRPIFLEINGGNRNGNPYNNMAEMMRRMQEHKRQQQQHHYQNKPVNRKDNKKTDDGEYIDYEEVD